MTRDIRETISSYLKFTLDNEKSIREIEIARGLLIYLRATYIPFIKIFNSLNKNSIRIIDLNSFHFNGRNAIVKLCKWLNIDFESNMTKSTVLGKPWYGNSSSQDKINGFDKSRSIKTYKKYLNSNEIQFIETFFDQFITKFYYKKDNKNRIYQNFPKIDFFNPRLYKIYSTNEIKKTILSINNNLFKILPFVLKFLIVFIAYGSFPNFRKYFETKKYYKKLVFQKANAKINNIEFKKNLFLCLN